MPVLWGLSDARMAGEAPEIACGGFFEGCWYGDTHMRADGTAASLGACDCSHRYGRRNGHSV